MEEESTDFVDLKEVITEGKIAVTDASGRVIHIGEDKEQAIAIMAGVVVKVVAEAGGAYDKVATYDGSEVSVPEYSLPSVVTTYRDELVSVMIGITLEDFSSYMESLGVTMEAIDVGGE